MIKSVKEYHDNTSYERNKLEGHRLDWNNQPALYKKYDGLINIPLPESPIPTGVRIRSILDMKPEASCPAGIDIKTLSTILYLTYSITAKAKYSGGTYYYRSAASAGALYPVEIYVMIRDMDGLDDGIYHYNILDNSLMVLRKGDFSGFTGTTTFPQSKNRPLLSFILSSIFFRSSWKYRDRAYRYHLLDTGHVLQNLILALNISSMPFNKIYDFDDEKINRLIGTDEYREAALSIINIPGEETLKDNNFTDIDTLPRDIITASIMSGSDTDYPSIRELHEAGKIPPHKEIPENTVADNYSLTEKWRDIENTDNPEKAILYPECLFRRRSKRNFVNEKISQNDFMRILDILSVDAMTNNGKTCGHEILKISFFAEKIDRVTPGLYVLDRTQRRFGKVREGEFGEKIAHTCLDQEWLKNAGLHFLISCNIEESDKKYGSRGYRYAMMDAGKVGQLLYITTTSLGLGCCGIGAFYDDEAINLVDLEGDSRLLYLVAAGKIKS